MNNDLPEYAVILSNAFHKLKLSDPDYSLRRFAKDINIHPAVLSLAMKGKRYLTPNDIDSAINFLEMNAEETIQFMKSSFFERMK